MEADVHGTSNTKDAVIETDKYARQDFNKVRDGGNNRTKREVDPASSVRIRSELNHNHDVSMGIQKDIEYESNSYVIEKTGEHAKSEILSMEPVSASFDLPILDDSSQMKDEQLMNVDGITFESMKTLSHLMKLKNCGEDVSDCVDQFLIKEVKRKFCDIENKSKIQEEVIKKRSDILIQPLESVSLTFLENKGQDSNLKIVF